MSSTLFNLELDGGEQRGGGALLQGEFDIVAIAPVFELFELGVVGGDEAAHHASVAHHALKLRLGVLEIAAGGGHIGLDAAHICLHAGNVAGHRADLLLGVLLLLREPGGLSVLRLLRGHNGRGAGVDLFWVAPTFWLRVSVG